MKKIILFITIVCLYFSNTSIVHANTVPSSWPTNQPTLNSEAAIVMEASTGAILYEKNINSTYYPASITKILTTLLAIENSKMNETVTHSKSAIFDVDLRSSRIGIDVGEELTMEQSLHGIMLESANEVSHAVAEHISGSVEDFSTLMNERAKELGALNSNFINPHGLPDANHYTTAYDMALIARTAIENEEFRKLVGTRTYTIPPTNKQVESRPLANSHRFSKTKSYYEGGIGGKTGYTSKALYTLVSFAERNGMTLITVIMKAESNENQYNDTVKLMDYGFDNFTLHKIEELTSSTTSDVSTTLESSQLFAKYSPLFSDSDRRLRVESHQKVVLPMGASFQDLSSEIVFHQLDTLSDGINVIGNIKYSYNEKYVGASNIIYDFSVKSDLLEGSYIPEPTIAATKVLTDSKEETNTLNISFLIIGILVTILVVSILLYYIFVQLPYLKRRRRYIEKRRKKDRRTLDF